jgi:putative acetyltransferase
MTIWAGIGTGARTPSHSRAPRPPVREPRIDRVLPPENVIIRCESITDLPAIRDVNEAAFERTDEAGLVDRLRVEGVVLLSLVAEHRSQIVGHILFSRMWIDTAHRSISAVALAPMAVLPAYQRQGIGGRLIRDGLSRLRKQGEEIVIVVGHPDYYPCFGFSTEKARSLESPFPGQAFMALDLRPGALDGMRGRVRYPPAFGL